ncbi:MAG: TlpA disulfide reductase family protein [Fulvivirga sp.]
MKKQLKEWGIFVGILLILFYTGWYKDIAAMAQRVVLATGLITADTTIPEGEIQEADYNFPLRDLEGNSVSLVNFKGKVIFMNVWATWCPPCIAEMPGIQDLYDKINHENIVFVMLSMDDDKAKPKKFIEKKGYTFPVFMPAGHIPEVFSTRTIPTTYVISTEGKIISRKTGMASYDTESFFDFLTNEAR